MTAIIATFGTFDTRAKAQTQADTMNEGAAPVGAYVEPLTWGDRYAVVYQVDCPHDEPCTTAYECERLQADACSCGDANLPGDPHCVTCRPTCPTCRRSVRQ